VNHFRLGYCLLEQKHYEEAEKTLRKALRMDRRHLTTYIFLGSLLLETERVQNAISMLKTALIIEPDSKTAQERLDITLT
jgi:tetratricopeptide (TPR) repeat protein